MEITRNIIRESKILNEGTTCYIMQYGNLVTYKLYKGAIEYIVGNGEYKLDEKETLNRLNYIVSKKNDVLLTELPKDILIFNGKPVGTEITYYDNSICLKNYLSENYSDEIISKVRQEIMSIIDELIKNGIVPTDPHFENFLVCYKNDGTYKLKMIDTDDQYISIYPDGKKDVWYESEVSTCYKVIDLSFEQLNNKKNI